MGSFLLRMIGCTREIRTIHIFQYKTIKSLRFHVEEIPRVTLREQSEATSRLRGSISGSSFMSFIEAVLRPLEYEN